MASVNKKQLVIIIAIILATNGVTAAVIASNHTEKSDTAVTVKDSNAVLTPTDVLKQASQYSGKVISVKGSVVHSKLGYYIAGQEKKNPGAILLDFDKSKVNPTSYANEAGKPQAAALDTSKPSTPTSASNKVAAKGLFTITGRLVQNPTSHAIVLVVESVK